MSPAEFALLLGVTIRTVGLWETDVVTPSRITAMVIRAAAEHARGLGRGGSDGRGTRRRRPQRPRASVRRTARPGA